MKRVRSSVYVVLGVGAFLSGCARDNDRLTLGDGRGNDIALTSIQPEPALTPASSASVNGVDRSAWPETAAAVPMDRVDACACGSGLARRAATARHDGRFPTAEEAVELKADRACRCGKAVTWQRAPVPAPEGAAR
jgi:hypothetical protein